MTVAVIGSLSLDSVDGDDAPQCDQDEHRRPSPRQHRLGSPRPKPDGVECELGGDEERRAVERRTHVDRVAADDEQHGVLGTDQSEPGCDQRRYTEHEGCGEHCDPDCADGREDDAQARRDGGRVDRQAGCAEESGSRED